MLYAPPVVYGDGEPVEVASRTDANGRFSLEVPRFRRFVVNGINFLVYSPGHALAARSLIQGGRHFALEKPKPRSIKVEGPDGRPIARARVAPRLIYAQDSGTAEVPPSLSEPLAATTAGDGTVTMNWLAARAKLAAVRVTAPAIGTQDIVLLRRPHTDAEPSVITIKLKKTNRISGRLVDADGRPVANQAVELWSRGDAAWIVPSTVEPPGGPLRTADDGSFQTPDCLIIGLPYRVAVREEGVDPIFSDWITIGESCADLAAVCAQEAACRARSRGRPARKTNRWSRGFSDRRRAQSHLDIHRERRPVFPGRFPPGAGFSVRAGRRFPVPRPVVEAFRKRRRRGIDPHRRAAQPVHEDAARTDSPAGVAGTGAALGRAALGIGWRTGNDAAKYRALSALGVVDPARVVVRQGAVQLRGPGMEASAPARAGVGARADRLRGSQRSRRIDR